MSEEAVAKLRVLIDNQEADKSIKDMENTARQLRATLRKVDMDTSDFEKGSKKLQEVDNKLKDVRNTLKGIPKDIEPATGSLNHLRLEIEKLEKELSNLPNKTKEFADKTKELQGLKSNFSNIKNEIDGVSKGMQLFKNQFVQIGVGAVGAELFTGALQAVGGFINSSIEKNNKLADSYTDMEKAIGGTRAEIRGITKELKEIDTRTTTADLKQIAISAGQLGIAKNDIVAFTSATDKLVVSLGDEFQGGAEEVTKTIGTLRNTFSDIKSDRIDEDMLKIGNALNELGASGMATGPVISDFAGRIGGIGITLGLTTGQVLGLSASLQETGVSVERGSTAVTKVLQKMLTNAGDFAKVAGLPVQEFTDLLNNDLYGAFMKVVSGSQKSASSATQLANLMDKLQLDGAGTSEVFAKLGKNTELVESKVNLASKALQNTSSIMSEFNNKNNNDAGQYEKAMKRIDGMISGIQVNVGRLAVGFINLFDDTAPNKQAEALLKEQASLNTLVLSISSRNEKDQDRKVLMEELNQKYPTFLSNLDKEKVTNNQLLATLEKVNEQYVNKIVLSKKQQEIEELANTAAEKKLKAKELEAMIINKTKYYAQGMDSKEYAGKGIAGGAEFVLNKSTGVLVDQKELGQFKGEISLYKSLLNDVKELENRMKNLSVQKDSFMKDFGLDSKSEDKKKTSKSSKIDLTDDELKAQEKALKKYIEETKRLYEELEQYRANAIKQEEERELALLKAKHEKTKTDIRGRIADEKAKSQVLIAESESYERQKSDIESKYLKIRQEKAYNDEVKFQANSYATKKFLLTKEYSDGLIQKGEFDQKMKEIEINFLQEKLQIQKDFGKSELEVNQNIIDLEKQQADEAFNLRKEVIKSEWEFKLSNLIQGSEEYAKASEEYLTVQIGLELGYTELTEKKKLEIKEKYAHRFLKLQEDLAKKDLKNDSKDLKLKESYNKQLTSMASNVGHSILQLDDVVNRNRDAKREKWYDGERKSLQSQLESKAISEEEYQHRLKVLDMKAESDRRDSLKSRALKQKLFSIASIGIDTASAAMKAMAELGPILGIPYAAGIIAMGAIQAGIVAGTPIPEAATGGDTQEVIGKSGNRYMAKMLSNNKSGDVSSPSLLIAGERGPEYILKSPVYQNPANVNFVRALKALNEEKVPAGYYDQMLSGFGSTSTSGSVNSDFNFGNNQSNSGELMAFMMKNNELLTEIKEQLKKPVPAIMNQDIYEKQQKDILKAQNLAGYKPKL